MVLVCVCVCGCVQHYKTEQKLKWGNVSYRVISIATEIVSFLFLVP